MRVDRDPSRMDSAQGTDLVQDTTQMPAAPARALPAYTPVILILLILSFATLRLENIDWETVIIRGWEQPKKHGAPRDCAIPERWVVVGDGRQGPGLEWYVKHVRSEVTDDVSPKAHVFLSFEGKPYSIRSIRNLISEGIHLALGIHNVSAHALRRACATWRYIHGWSIEDIAALLDDDPKVVQESYVDMAYVKSKGRKRHRRSNRYPEVDWIRPAGKAADFDATPQNRGSSEILPCPS